MLMLSSGGSGQRDLQIFWSSTFIIMVKAQLVFCKLYFVIVVSQGCCYKGRVKKSSTVMLPLLSSWMSFMLFNLLQNSHLYCWKAGTSKRKKEKVKSDRTLHEQLWNILFIFYIAENTFAAACYSTSSYPCPCSPSHILIFRVLYISTTQWDLCPKRNIKALCILLLLGSGS